MTRTPLQGQEVKGQGHQAALVCCTGWPTWTYSNGRDLSICVHDVYRVTRPGWGISWRPPAYSLFLYLF